MLISFFIYIATVASIPAYIGYFSILFIKKSSWVKIYNQFLTKEHLFLLGLVLMINANRYLDFNTGYRARDYFPDSILILFMYYLSITLTTKQIKYLVVFITIESIVVYFEFFIGKPSILPGYSVDIVDLDFLYFNRPLGLSSNTSHVALKLFLATLLLVKYNLFKPNIQRIILFVILGSVVLTFNRTVIVSVIVLGILQIVNKYSKGERRVLLLAIIGIIGIILVYTNFLQYFNNQITVGRTGAGVLSGRVYIWEEFIKHIKTHLLFGNNSIRYSVIYYGNVAHAHNSFLHILATHGLLISVYYVVFFFSRISSKNFVVVLPILVFSTSQLGIFWSFSITDIVLFIFLFNKILENEANT